MGNKITQLEFRTRVIIFAVLVCTIATSVYFAYPIFSASLKNYAIRYYTYSPKQEVKSEVDLASTSPAIAVPVLVYHGVTKYESPANTTIKNFISQMEMLKREGYETISTNDLHQFYLGNFTLPAKPIVITFDDGRKDSYYTTDDVLRKLGFKATIFAATGPTLDGNNFFLTWADYADMLASGRWEIEAHGRESHEQISLNKEGTEVGKFLTSRKYLPELDRVETVEEFEERVLQDYLNNKKDLKEHLGVEARYIAVPLNDYGLRPVSNYPEAAIFNRKIVNENFDLAFVQANNDGGTSELVLPAYNFRSDSPFSVKRIEVASMETQTLKELLAKEAPVMPNIVAKDNDFSALEIDPKLELGSAMVTEDGLLITAADKNQNGEITFGKSTWHDYTIEADLVRVAGRSISLSFYKTSPKNYLAFGVTDRGYFFRKVENGVQNNLQISYIPDLPISGPIHLKVRVKDGRVTAWANDRLLYSKIPVSYDHGLVSVRVWDNNQIAQGLIKAIKVSPSL